MPIAPQYVTGGDVQQIINAANQAIYGISNNIYYVANSANNAINGTYYNAVNGINGAIGNLNYNASNILNNVNYQVSNIANQVNYRINTSNTDTVNRITSSLSGVVNNGNSNILRAIDAVNGGLSARISGIDDKVTKAQKVITDKIDGIIVSGSVSTEEFKRMLKESTQKLYETAFIATNNMGDKVANFMRQELNAQISKLGTQADEIYKYLNEHLAYVGNTIEQKQNLVIKQLQANQSAIEAVTSGLTSDLEKGLSKVTDDIFGQLHKFLLELSHNAEQTNSLIANILRKIKLGRYSSFDDLQKDLNDFGGVMPIAKAILLIMGLKPAIESIVVSSTAPYAKTFEQLSNADTRGSLLPFDEYVKAYYHHLIEQPKLNEKLAKYGLSDTDQALYTLSNSPRLDTTSLQFLFLRGKITEQELDKELEWKGFSSTDIKRIKQLYNIIPQPSDLIRMAVKEVFSPETVKKFGQYEDFPEQFADYAEQQGLTRQWALNYWAAHWELPSPQMGFEMYQRRIIDKPTLTLLLKALDVMPFWRDKLIQLNFNPLTRVDVRRMYGEGILTEEQVYNAYLDIGYSPENAKNLRNFTVAIEKDDPDIKASQIRSMTKSVLTQAYEKGMINRAETKQRLQAVGYTSDDSELLLDLIDFKILIDNKPDRRSDYTKRMLALVKSGYSHGLMPKQEAYYTLIGVGYTDDEANTELSYEDYEYNSKLRQYVIDYIKATYSEYTIDINEATNTLRAYNFSQGEIDRILQEANIIASTRGKKPTLADIIKFYKNGLFDDNQFINELRGLGYHDRYVWYYYVSTHVGSK